MKEKLALNKFVITNQYSAIFLGKCWKTYKEDSGKSKIVWKWYKVLEKFKIQNIRLWFWAKSPQSHSIMTFNSSFERNFHKEFESNNDLKLQGRLRPKIWKWNLMSSMLENSSVLSVWSFSSLNRSQWFSKFGILMKFQYFIELSFLNRWVTQIWLPALHYLAWRSRSSEGMFVLDHQV